MRIIIILIIIIFIIFICSNNIYIKSYSDNIYYKVQRNLNKYRSVKYLSSLRKFTINLISNLDTNHIIYRTYYNRFIKLNSMIRTIKINEKTIIDNNTSYTINKGDEIVLCLKFKENDKYHDINDIKYILIHELSHIICPEIGHTKIFYDINKYLLTEAIRLKLHNITNYKLNPFMYCGIKLNEYLL